MCRIFEFRGKVFGIIKCFAWRLHEHQELTEAEKCILYGFQFSYLLVYVGITIVVPAEIAIDVHILEHTVIFAKQPPLRVYLPKEVIVYFIIQPDDIGTQPHVVVEIPALFIPIRAIKPAARGKYSIGGNDELAIQSFTLYEWQRLLHKRQRQHRKNKKQYAGLYLVGHDLKPEVYERIKGGDRNAPRTDN